MFTESSDALANYERDIARYLNIDDISDCKENIPLYQNRKEIKEETNKHQNRKQSVKRIVVSDDDCSDFEGKSTKKQSKLNFQKSNPKRSLFSQLPTKNSSPRIDLTSLRLKASREKDGNDVDSEHDLLPDVFGEERDQSSSRITMKTQPAEYPSDVEDAPDDFGIIDIQHDVSFEGRLTQHPASCKIESVGSGNILPQLEEEDKEDEMKEDPRDEEPELPDLSGLKEEELTPSLIEAINATWDWELTQMSQIPEAPTTVIDASQLDILSSQLQHPVVAPRSDFSKPPNGMQDDVSFDPGNTIENLEDDPDSDLFDSVVARERQVSVESESDLLDDLSDFTLPTPTDINVPTPEVTSEGQKRVPGSPALLSFKQQPKLITREYALETPLSNTKYITREYALETPQSNTKFCVETPAVNGKFRPVEASTPTLDTTPAVPLRALIKPMRLPSPKPVTPSSFNKRESSVLSDLDVTPIRDSTNCDVTLKDPTVERVSGSKDETQLDSPLVVGKRRRRNNLFSPDQTSEQVRPGSSSHCWGQAHETERSQFLANGHGH